MPKSLATADHPSQRRAEREHAERLRREPARRGNRDHEQRAFAGQIRERFCTRSGARRRGFGFRKRFFVHRKRSRLFPRIEGCDTRYYAAGVPCCGRGIAAGKDLGTRCSHIQASTWVPRGIFCIRWRRPADACRAVRTDASRSCACRASRSASLEAALLVRVCRLGRRRASASRRLPQWRTPLTLPWLALLAAMLVASVASPVSRVNALAHDRTRDRGVRRVSARRQRRHHAVAARRGARVSRWPSASVVSVLAILEYLGLPAGARRAAGVPSGRRDRRRAGARRRAAAVPDDRVDVSRDRVRASASACCWRARRQSRGRRALRVAGWFVALADHRRGDHPDVHARRADHDGDEPAAGRGDPGGARGLDRGASARRRARPWRSRRCSLARDRASRCGCASRPKGRSRGTAPTIDAPRRLRARRPSQHAEDSDQRHQHRAPAWDSPRRRRFCSRITGCRPTAIGSSRSKASARRFRADRAGRDRGDVDVDVRAPRAARATIAWSGIVVQEGRLWFSAEPGAARRCLARPSSSAMPPRTRAAARCCRRRGRRSDPDVSCCGAPRCACRRASAARRRPRQLPSGVRRPTPGCQRADARTHSNNMYLEMLAGGGLVVGAGVRAGCVWRAAGSFARAACGAGRAAGSGGRGSASPRRRWRSRCTGSVDSFLSFAPTYILFALTLGCAVACARGMEADPMRIAFDGTTLRPGRTGVGYYTEHLLHHLGAGARRRRADRHLESRRSTRPRRCRRGVRVATLVAPRCRGMVWMQTLRARGCCARSAPTSCTSPTAWCRWRRRCRPS